MNNTVEIENIINKIAKLDNATKKQLLDQIQHLLGNIEPKKKYRLTDIQGLGKGLWEVTDVDSYILNERQWD